MLTLLPAFIGMNLNGAANRKFYDSDESSKTRQSFNSNCIYLITLSFIVSLLLNYNLSDYSSSLSMMSANWIYIAITIVYCNSITLILLGQWQVRGFALQFCLINIFKALVIIALSLYFVIYLGHGGTGSVLAQLVGACIVCLLSFWLLKVNNFISFTSFNITFSKEALLYGLPLIPHVIGLFLISTMDRYFIGSNFNSELLGLYSVAVQISLSLNIIFMSLNQAYIPWLFKTLKENNSKSLKKVVKNTYLFYIFLLFVSLLLFIIGPQILVLIAGDKYSKASDVIGYLFLGQIFHGMYLTVTNYIFYSKKTWLLSASTIFCGCINITLLFFFVPAYGIKGAAVVFVISKFTQFLLTWFISNTVQPMPWLKILEVRHANDK
jgi:O-antigen/teichoic acid export membrane protein